MFIKCHILIQGLVQQKEHTTKYGCKVRAKQLTTNAIKEKTTQ